MTTRPHQNALIKLMAVMAAADGTISEQELKRIADLVRRLPAFASVTADELVRSSSEAAAMLQADDGLDMLIDEACAVLDEKMRETAYALVVEIAATDLEATQEELRLLELLRDRLSVDMLMAAAIEASARVRHRRGPSA